MFYVNFCNLFFAHAPRGNRLRLTGPACINETCIYLYLVISSDHDRVEFDSNSTLQYVHIITIDAHADCDDYNHHTVFTILFYVFKAFIYAVIKCCAHEVYEDLDVVYEYYQPKLLPLCLSQSLCIPTQTNWWNAFYTLFTGTVRYKV